MSDVVTPHELVADLGSATRWLILLDFDGCLSPLVDEPDDAQPAAGAIDAIRALAELTTVAIISGRPVEDLRRRLPADLPAVLAGGHGAELAQPGEAATALVAVDQAVLDDLAIDVATMVDTADGWRIERKPASVAVHHRMVAADRRTALPSVKARFEEAAAGGDFVVLDGHDVTELRPTSTDKGRVVALLADRHPGLLPLSFGDDATDEDAFAEAVARGGRAVLIATVDRPTRADVRLGTPDDVVATLTALAVR